MLLGNSFVEDNFTIDWEVSGWFQVSNTLHLLYILFLLLYQHLRLSGIRSQRLGNPGLEHTTLPHLCRGSTSHFIQVFVHMSFPKIVYLTQHAPSISFNFSTRQFPKMAAMDSVHQKVESVFPSLSLGSSCDLL